MSTENKKTILLVEDEVITAMLEKQQLEKYGYTVHHITTGEKAVSTITEDNFQIDLILMDIDLGPGIDGTRAAEQILSHKDIPVIFLSSHTEPEVVEKTEKITSYGYVVKSTSIVVLDASIKMALKLFNAKIKHKLAEEKIQEMDVRMWKLFENVPDLIYQFTRKADGSYCVPIASKGVSNIFGCSPEEIRDNFEPISRVIYPEDIARVIEDIEYSAKHLTHFTCEFRVHIPGRDIQWILSRSSPERLPDGSVTWYGFNLDITKHKQAKEDRRKFELRWDSLVQSIPDYIAIHDLEGKFIYINQYAEGFSEKDIIGKSAYSFMTPESAELFRSKSKLCVQTKQIQHFEHKAQGGLGKICNYENYIIPIIENDICFNLLIVSRNITERKKAEIELKLKENAIETSINAIAFADLQGFLTYVNDSFIKMWGLDKKEEVIGKQAISFWESSVDASEIIDNLYKKGSWEGELKAKKKDNELFDVLLSASLIKDDNGNPICMMSSFEDITERKQAEEDLIESELLLRSIAENYPNSFISIIENDLTVGYTAGQEFKKLNLDPLQFIGMTLEQVFGEFAPIVRENYNKSFKGAETEFELFINNQYQIYRTVPLMDQSGRINRILSVVENITARKKMEQLILDERSFLNTILMTTADGFWVINNQKQFTHVNDTYCRMSGYTRDEILTMSIQDIDAGEDPVKTESRIQRIIDNGKEIFEVNHRRKDGTIFNVEISAAFSEMDGGILICFCRDITDRKLSEQMLFQSESQKKAILNGIRTNIAYVDSNLRIIWANKTATASVNLESDDLCGHRCYELWANPAEPCLDCPSLKAFQTHKSEHLIMKTPDGRYWDEKGEPVFNDNGELVGVVEIAQDITDRVRAEEEIKKQLAEKEILMREVHHRVKNNIGNIESF